MLLGGTALALSFLVGAAPAQHELVGSAHADQGGNSGSGGGSGSGAGAGLGAGLGGLGGIGAGLGVGLGGGSSSGSGSGSAGSGTGSGTSGGTGVGVGAGLGVGLGGGSSGSGTGSAGTGTGSGTSSGTGVDAGVGLGIGLGGSSGSGTGSAGTGTGTGSGTSSGTGVDAGVGLGIGLGGSGTGSGTSSGTGVDAGVGLGIGLGGSGTGSGTGSSGDGSGSGSGGGTGSGSGGGTTAGGGTGSAGGGGIGGAGSGEGLSSGGTGSDLASADSGGPTQIGFNPLGDIAPSAAPKTVTPLHEWRWVASSLPSVQAFRFDEGAVVFLSTGGFVKYVGVHDGTITTENAAHNVAQRPGGFFTPLSGSIYDANAPSSLWPLKVGKTVHFVQHRDNDAWQQTVKVLRTETIEVPAGRFQAFVVQREARGLGATNFLATYTYWYAPNPGVIVKFEVDQRAGAAVAEKPWVATRVLVADSMHAAN